MGVAFDTLSAPERAQAAHGDRFVAHYYDQELRQQKKIPGSFATAVEAAVAYAKRAAGDEEVRGPRLRRVEGEPSSAPFAVVQGDDAGGALMEAPLATEAPVYSHKDGYKLALSEKNPTGYRGVYVLRDVGAHVHRYEAQYARKHLGRFDTAVEAAVCYARHVEELKASGPKEAELRRLIEQEAEEAEEEAPPAAPVTMEEAQEEEAPPPAPVPMETSE